MDFESVYASDTRDATLTVVEAVANPRSALGLPVRSAHEERASPRLTLPDAAREVLEPPLRLLRFTLEDRVIEDVRENVWYTVAARPDLTIFLVHFDSAILEDGDRWSEVSKVAFLFANLRAGNREGSLQPLRIVSVGAREVAFAYDKLWLQWSNMGFEAIYIEWYRLRQLGAIKDERQRANELPRVLKLDERTLLSSRADRPADLQRSEAFGILASMLVKRASTVRDPSNYFRDLVQNQAKLPNEWRTERMWTDVSEAGARELLNWLIQKGTNPEQPSYTALASFVVCLLDWNIDDRPFLVELLATYGLVKEQRELDAIRQRYLHPGAEGR